MRAAFDWNSKQTTFYFYDMVGNFCSF